MVRGRKVVDNTGKTFGSFEVVGSLPRKKRGRLIWILICKHCGKMRKINSSNLSQNPRLFCVCQRDKKTRKRAAAYHGGVKFNPDREAVESATREYLKNGGKITRDDRERSGEELMDQPVSCMLDKDFVDSPNEYLSCNGHTRGR